jgi:PAS domain S-box-containing protein
MIVTDLAGQITSWNMGAERLSGWTSEESVGRSLRDVLGFEGHSEIDMAGKALQGSDEWRGEFRLNSKLGKLYVLEISATLIRDDDGRPKAHLYIGTDVTAKKSLEEQFLRAQRLESIGMLASGIAHDLNNVLAPILLAAPMLRSRATNPADLRMIATLEKSAERGAGLVRQILGFAHGVGGTQQSLQVKHLVRDTASVVAETFPKSITLDDSVAADLWPVLANPTQIHQVLLNLCVNARDAMPGGGTLVLRAENCLLDGAAASAMKGASPGAWTVLHVQDSGTGIPADVLEHIWEPFYTTKGIGKGTGLGLSTVRGIVENHKGFIELRTEPGVGTTFRVYLPAAKDPSRGEKAGSVHPFEARGAGELILVVDDEAQIREVAAAILRRFGYKAIVAADGNEALAAFAARPGEICMLITDLSMPNMDGLSLAREVLKLKPETKVLAMSGLASGDVHAGIQQYAGALLAKPFTADELLGAVTRLLREARAPGG